MVRRLNDGQADGQATGSGKTVGAISSPYPAYSGARYGGGSESKSEGRAHAGSCAHESSGESCSSDEKLIEVVCESLSEAGDLNASDITVEMERGVLVLKGSVGNIYQRNLAAEIAHQAAGVVGIDNRIQLAKS
jgi:osmotically-inducible protein OsmY